LGDASYSLYLTHPLTVEIMAWLPLPPDVLWVTMFAACIGVGLAVHHWLEAPLVRLALSPKTAARELGLAYAPAQPVSNVTYR
jgi:peptidoglycan/LPS O-acetylase OafA/YrhL